MSARQGARPRWTLGAADWLVDTFWLSLCKVCHRFFPLNTAPVTRGVVPPQTQH